MYFAPTNLKLDKIRMSDFFCSLPFVADECFLSSSNSFQVRYEIIGRGKATKYFQIDPDTGVVRVTNDLKKEIDTEYQVRCSLTFRLTFL